MHALALPRGRSLVLVAGSVGLYMLLVSPETPVVRATLLVWIACLAAAIGRRPQAMTSLAAAAILVLAWHPPEVFRVGTQLSFLSTAVLVGVTRAFGRWRVIDDPIERLIETHRPPWERRLRRLGLQVFELVVVGAAIWALTAPLVAARFHVLSPIGLLLNPLIAPLVPLAMAFGGLCLLAAPVSSLLAGLFGSLCDLVLGAIEAIVDAAATVPGGYAWIPGPPLWWAVGWYAGSGLMLLCLPREALRRPTTWILAAAAWCGLGWIGVAVTGSGPQSLEVVVAAMGHGCGIVVRSPAGRVIVYDAGRLGAPGAACRGMAAVLWSRSVTRIDTLVLSHADTDHFNAVPDLLERFAVGEVRVSGAFLRSDSLAVRELLREIHERRIPIRPLAVGDEIPADPLCRIRVLHQDERGADDNQTSIVLSVEAAGRRLLLTGDIEGNGLARFVAADPEDCDVLVAPHHGSITSLPADIARETRPAWIIVSGLGGRAGPRCGWPTPPPGASIPRAGC